MKRYSSQIKADVVSEMLKGNSTLAKICSKYGVKERSAKRWKRKALDRLPSIFKPKHPEHQLKKKIMQAEQTNKQLKAEAKHLRLEADFLKKNWDACQLRNDKP